MALRSVRAQATLLELEKRWESAWIKDLTRTHRIILERFEQNLAAVEQSIAAAEAAGQTVTPYQLFRERHWQKMIDEYSAGVQQMGLKAQEWAGGGPTPFSARQMVESARASVSDQIPTGATAAQVTINNAFTGIDWAALATTVEQNWTSRVANLFSGFATETASQMEDALAFGMASGRSFKDTARELRKVGNIPMTRAAVISRTEGMRAMREAAREVYQQSSVTNGWIWWVTHDDRVCFLCLSQHGKKFKTVDGSTPTMDSHPNCRCVMLPDLKSWEELGVTGVGPDPYSAQLNETGEDVLRSMSQEDQEAILGAARKQLWESGDLPLSDMSEWVQNGPYRNLAPRALDQISGASSAAGGAAESVATLSRDEMLRAAAEYQQGTFSYLFREGRSLTPEQAKITQGLDALIAAQKPLESSREVFRGISYFGDDEFGKLVDRLKAGDTFTDAGFVSTTKLKGAAQVFVESQGPGRTGRLLRIELPKGTRGFEMDELAGTKYVKSGYEGYAGEEGEFLLPRGSSFKVVEVTPGEIRLKLIVETPPDAARNNAELIAKLDNDNLRELLQSGRFNYEIKLVEKRSADDLYEINYWPKPTEGIKVAQGEHYDAAISKPIEGAGKYDRKVELKPDSGYVEELPLTTEPEFIYRGMSYEEMQDILRTGRIRSNASYNMAGQEETTSFGIKAETAKSYASGFAPELHSPTFGRPAFIIKVRRSKVKWKKAVTGDDYEVDVIGDIPLTDIEGIVEVRPYSIRGGDALASYDWNTDILHAGSRSGFSSRDAYRTLSIQDTRRLLRMEVAADRAAVKEAASKAADELFAAAGDGLKPPTAAMRIKASGEFQNARRKLMERGDLTEADKQAMTEFGDRFYAAKTRDELAALKKEADDLIERITTGAAKKITVETVTLERYALLGDRKWAAVRKLKVGDEAPDFKELTEGPLSLEEDVKIELELPRGAMKPGKGDKLIVKEIREDAAGNITLRLRDEEMFARFQKKAAESEAREARAAKRAADRAMDSKQAEIATADQPADKVLSGMTAADTAEVQETYELLQVTKYGDLPERPKVLKLNSSHYGPGGESGRYRVRSQEILVYTGANDIRVTFIHEYSHWLDLRMGGYEKVLIAKAKDRFARGPASYLKSDHYYLRTRLVDELQRSSVAADLTRIASGLVDADSASAVRHATYLLKDTEMIARAFTQYFAEEIGGETHIGFLRMVKERSLSSNPANAYWSFPPEDWVKIKPLIDEYLRGMKLSPLRKPK